MDAVRPSIDQTMISPHFRNRIVGGLCVSVALGMGLRGVVNAERTLRSRQEVTDLRLAQQNVALRTLQAIDADQGRMDSLARVVRDAVLPADSWESGTAELVAAMRLALSRAGARLESVSPVPADTTPTSTIKPVSVQLAFRSDLRGVVGVLRDLHHSQTVLVPQSIQLSAAEPFADSSTPEVLRVELTVTGWYLKR